VLHLVSSLSAACQQRCGWPKQHIAVFIIESLQPVVLTSSVGQQQRCLLLAAIRQAHGNTATPQLYLWPRCICIL
jgi:hypothetical protein